MSTVEICATGWALMVLIFVTIILTTKYRVDDDRKE